MDRRISGANEQATEVLEATDRDGIPTEIREEETIVSSIDRWRREWDEV